MSQNEQDLINLQREKITELDERLRALQGRIDRYEQDITKAKAGTDKNFICETLDGLLAPVPKAILDLLFAVMNKNGGLPQCFTFQLIERQEQKLEIGSDVSTRKVRLYQLKTQDLIRPYYLFKEIEPGTPC